MHIPTSTLVLGSPSWPQLMPLTNLTYNRRNKCCWQKTIVFFGTHATLAHRMQHNSIRAAGRAQTALDHASDSEKAQELEELMVRLAAEAESGLTSEERRASLERSKIIQAQVTHLRNEGVSLRRGRKSKKAPEPSTQPSSVMASSNTNMPPSTAPQLSACTSS
ncbi:hypothetical protein K439DRAFT_1629814 [Ramaria rubella]|nr:hypothetical protein K439DRAFT_1629814 [Ramaria rubella]